MFLDEVLCIYYATHSVRLLVSPFVQLKWKSKMAARYLFFFNCDQLAKEVPPGTCFIGPVQYDRTFLGPRALDTCNMTEVSMENILNY